MVVVFFDLVTFFGVASFFAWLTFAPLQSDQLQTFEEEWRRARANFSTINDYFLVSFLFYALSAGCDYLYNKAGYANYRADLYAGIGFGFFAGITGLLWAMLYVRLIVKGEKDWDNIDPPGFLYTLFCFGITVVSAFFEARSTFGFIPVENAAWLGAFFLTAWGGWNAIRYHDRKEWKKLGRRTGEGITGLAVLVLTPLVVLGVVIPFLRYIESLNLVNEFGYVLLAVLVLVWFFKRYPMVRKRLICF
jgi:hypothetical protein